MNMLQRKRMTCSVTLRRGIGMAGECLLWAGNDTPLCNQSIKSQVPPKQAQTLPPLTEKSCSIRHDDGSRQIITPITAKSEG